MSSLKNELRLGTQVRWDALALEFGIKDPQDWSRISINDIVIRLKTLLPNQPKHTYLKIISENPGFTTNSHLLQKETKLEDQRKFLDNIAIKFGIKKPTDWGNVRVISLRKAGLDILLEKHENSLFKLLQNVYKGVRT